MLIPFLKIPAHYSTSDRVGQVRKIKIKKRKQWGLAKRKIKPKKKRKFKTKGLTTKNLKQRVQKKKPPKTKGI